MHNELNKEIIFWSLSEKMTLVLNFKTEGVSVIDLVCCQYQQIWYEFLQINTHESINDVVGL